MKALAALSLILPLGLAGPIAQMGGGTPVPLGNDLKSTMTKLRGKDGKLDGGMRPIERNDLQDGKCSPIVFIFARASTEPGNMGASMGPMVCTGLKKIYGDQNVVCQGVGGAYTAGIEGNILKKGTTDGAISEGVKMFNLANTKCPQATIVFGGYSQGTAVMHNTVSSLPKALQEKIVGGVLFGDTRNKQDSSQVPNFPKDKVKVFCVQDDGVCWGKLNVTLGHFVYATNGDGDKAIAFLKGKIDGAKNA